VTLSRFPRNSRLFGFTRRFAIVAGRLTPTNRRLLEAARHLGADATLVSPEDCERRLRTGDVALARLDVLPTLDGVEPGLDALKRLEDRGVDVLNPAGALLGAHDKLTTALRLGAWGVPHPRTTHFGEDGPAELDLPAVLKPRFGSWGLDVAVCRHRFALRRGVRALRGRAWFERQGALAQDLIPPQGHDLRLVVAGGEVVGAIERVARRGEWRTNVSLGGTRRSVQPPDLARELAVRAAEAIGADLVGVDLLPDADGGYVVLELNGAADFNHEYALDGADVFERAVDALTRYAREHEAPAEETAVAARVGA
jgi:RimK family alpha-L-glutamate ligase